MKNKIALILVSLCVALVAMSACSARHDEVSGTKNVGETAVETPGVSDEKAVSKTEDPSDAGEYSAGVGDTNGTVVETDADGDKAVGNAGGKTDPYAPSKAPLVPDGKTNGSVDPAGTIGVERAKEIALEKAGITSDGVFFEKVELDRDDRLLVYELEFRKDGIEYEIEIKADDGTVLSWEKDRDGRK